MKAARLLAITLLLQARGRLTAMDLGRVLEVSPRTIYRDIASLEQARVPIVAFPGPEGGYSLPEGYKVDPMLFSGDEAASLAIGGAFVQGMQEIAISASLQQALAKIEAALPPAYRESVRAGRERFLFDGAEWYAVAGRPSGHLPLLRTAVLQGIRVRLCYQSRDAKEGQWREVDPLGLVYKAGIWYLTGFCHSKRGLRTFRLGRIQAAEALARPRDEYPDFDLARYWEESRARVEDKQSFPIVVQADASVATDLLERPVTFLSVQRIEDGSVRASIDGESTAWAVGFALGFMGHIEVIAPHEVRAAVAIAAKAVADRHGQGTVEQ